MRLLSRTWSRVAELAWPVVATGAIRATMRTVDLLVLGTFVGPAAVAAVGIADVIGRVVLQTALGLGAGTIAQVSQYHGAGRHQQANIVATQTAVIAFIVGMPVTVVGWFLADDYFRLIGADQEVVGYGVVYLQVVLLSAAFRIAAMMLARGLQGTGDTRTPMVIRTAATLTNIALTVVLVIGVGPAPALGVLGAAIGTAVGNTLAGTAFLAALASRRFGVQLDRAGLWAPDAARTTLRIGAPQALERNVYAIGEIPLNAIILVFGTEANAAFQIARRLEQYARIPGRAGATASSALVGNELGNQHPDRSDRYGRGSLTLTVAVSSLAAVALFVFAGPLARLFTDDPATLDFAIDWVRVLALGTVFRSVFIALRGALQGAGDTTSPLYATMMGIGVFTLLFSYVVGVLLGVGIVAVYVGVTLDYVVRSAFLYHRYSRGGWKQASLADG